MRFAIIVLISSLLASVLGASVHQRQSMHGKFAAYQGANGTEIGLIVGKPGRRQGNYKIAPVGLGEPVVFHQDRVVRVHPGDVVNVPLAPEPHEASLIVKSHKRHKPAVTVIKRPILGSPHYLAAQTLLHIKNGGHPGVGFYGPNGPPSV